MQEFISHEERIGSIRLRIIADNDASNPRTDYDHPGTILCCDHRRYDLGDRDAHGDVARLIRASRDYRPGWEESAGPCLNFTDGPDLWLAVQRCRDIVALPCYLYDHSGITMSTAPFSCPWDSGQVGFICMGRSAILELFENSPKGRLTRGLRERALQLLRAEVEEYDQFLTGDVWGYVVDRSDGTDLTDGDDHACWGLFGSAHALETGREELRRAAARYPDLAHSV